VKLILMFKR